MNTWYKASSSFFRFASTVARSFSPRRSPILGQVADPALRSRAKAPRHGRSFIGTLLAICFFGLLGQAAVFAEWKAGLVVPDLSGYELRGELPSLEGKVTYLDFWASWCAPCKASFPALEELYQKYGDDGFQVVAVSVDTQEKAMRRFLDNAKPSFAIAWDPKHGLVSDAGIEAMPTSFLIDAKGVVRDVHIGWSSQSDAEELERKLLELLEELP